MPRADAARGIMEHLSHVRAPLVLLVTPYCTDSASFVQQAPQEIKNRIRPCPTVAAKDRVLQRRLAIFEDMPGAAAYDVAQQLLRSEGPAGPTDPRQQVLFIRNVELLDQESSVVVDLLLREQRVGLIMTCTSESRLGFRFSRPMQGPRGLTVQLPGPTAAEVHGLLTATLGAAPTSTLTEYLQAITGGGPQELRIAARVGLDEGWIGVHGSHSALLHPPAWMDRLTAAEILAVMRSDFGDTAVQVLQRIAVCEQVELQEFMHDDDTRDGVFWLAEAGLLRISGSHVRLQRSIFRHPLVFSAQPTGPAPTAATAQTPSSALRRLAHAEHLDEPTIVRTATYHLEQGLLEQARFLASRLPADNPRRACLSASVLAASGAKITAAEMLAGVELPEAVALRGFLTGSRRSVPSSADAQEAEHHTGLHHFNDYQPRQYLQATAPPVPVAAAEDHAAAPEPHVVDIDLLRGCTQAALDAYAAALADDAERAHTSWRAATAIPAAELPIVALGWVIERVGMSRIFNDPGAELYPEGWLDGESAERRLRYALTLKGQRLLQGLLCGAEIEQLRRDTEDLWNQFDAGLPAGSLSRRFFEAMDHAIGGVRSAELDGPAELVPPGLSATFRDATNDTVVLLGRLLRTPLSELVPTIEDVFHRTEQTPGMRRTTLRCLLLRRGAEMPTELLNTVLDYGRRAQVKKEVLAAAAELAGDQRVRSRVLGAPVPGRPGLRFCPAPQLPAADTQERVEAATTHLLSKREGEIAKHLMAGAGAADVAGDLHISVRTVHTHVRNIYRKLDVTSRTQLRARLAERQTSP